jgi:hypothetical protein
VTHERTEGLIAKLAADLEPVNPITPIPRTLAGVLGVAACVAAIVFATYGLKPDLWTALMTNLTYAGVLIGLAAATVGGCVGALASVVPGREGLMRLGAALAVSGVLLGVGIAAWMTPWGDARLEEPMAQMACIARGTVFAVPPTLAVLALAARGWSGRPGVTVALGLFGTGAVGALLVHLTCPATEPLHILCMHTSTPIVIALLLTAALAPSMRRWAR